MSALAKLFFSGALQKLLSAASAALGWLLADWRNAPLAVFAIGYFWLTFLTVPGIERERDTALDERAATMAAYTQTVANYLAAAEQAQAIADANVRRVAREQAAITQETIDDYESRLAAVRARADSLRSAARRTAGDPGRPVQSGVPGPGAAASGADAPTGDPGLSAATGACPAAFVCLTIDQALIASEQAIQLDALISWVEQQSALQFSPQGGQ